MNIIDIPANGIAEAVCTCGQLVVVVDRYLTDRPPIPRFNPMAFIQFYRDEFGDPDDLILECPGCGEWLDLTVLRHV
jgi:hypothetical protein